MPQKPSTFPDAHQIEAMFSGTEGDYTFDDFKANLAKNVEVVIMGHDHELASTHTGADAWKEDVLDRIWSCVDYTKPFKWEVVQVIGGGDSPNAAIEMKATGKTKSGKSISSLRGCFVGCLMSVPCDIGKKYNHEFVHIVKFDLSGKMTKIRGYYDSSHLETHIGDNITQNGA